jgi:predicted ArsR family transcriptional regulator
VTGDRLEARLAAIAALAEPARRLLYRYVAAQTQPVSRDQAAAGVGVPHHVAKFHLDRLVDDGLLSADYSRPPGRGGPGAGRPAKLYQRADVDLEVSVPDRRYDLAGRLLASAVARAAREERPAVETLRDVAIEVGRDRGAAARERLDRRPRRAEVCAAVLDALADEGYEPCLEGGDVTLVNCPFDALARVETELVCGMNLAYCEGLIEGVGKVPMEAVLDPAPGRCCVRLNER